MLGDPITELTIAMELNYFQLNSAEYFVPLAVKIPGNELVLAQKEGAERTVIDFIGEIRNEYGTIISNIRDKVEIQAEGRGGERGWRQAPSNTMRVSRCCRASTSIKFLARNAETGRIGTYQASFVVPNLNKELVRLPISSVVLSSQRVRDDGCAVQCRQEQGRRKRRSTNPLIEDGQKLIPSVTRVFSKSRELLYLLAGLRAGDGRSAADGGIRDFLSRRGKGF